MNKRKKNLSSYSNSKSYRKKRLSEKVFNRAWFKQIKQNQSIGLQ